MSRISDWLLDREHEGTYKFEDDYYSAWGADRSGEEEEIQEFIRNNVPSTTEENEYTFVF